MKVTNVGLLKALEKALSDEVSKTMRFAANPNHNNAEIRSKAIRKSTDLIQRCIDYWYKVNKNNSKGNA